MKPKAGTFVCSSVMHFCSGPTMQNHSGVDTYLRKIAERSVAGLMHALEACAHIFKPAECANYFEACGYDTT